MQYNTAHALHVEPTTSVSRLLEVKLVLIHKTSGQCSGIAAINYIYEAITVYYTLTFSTIHILGNNILW